MLAKHNLEHQNKYDFSNIYVPEKEKKLTKRPTLEMIHIKN